MKKDQFIIAYFADFGHTDVVLSWALFLAQMLGKGLILLHISDPRYTDTTPDQAEQELQKIKSDINSNRRFSGLSANNVSYAALKGDSRQVITALPTLLNAVAVVAEVDAHAGRRSALGAKSLLRNFAECKTAFLIAQDPIRNASDLKDVALTVDFRKESKDKFIWSSYFPRFGGITNHVLYYDYKDEFLNRKWYANMQQLHKLYTGLGITFKPEIIESKSTYQDLNALRFCHENNIGMLISVTTKEKDGLEFFIGVQESRTIINSQRIPILFLNPREDLYVLCD